VAEATEKNRLPATFASLAIRDYRLYFAAMLLYFGAMQATVLARPWVAFDLSADDQGQRSALVLGVTIAVNNAPSLVLSPWAGALADRISKRNILMVAAVLMAGLALTTSFGIGVWSFEWWHVTIIGVVQGTVMTFITPTRRAIIAELVDRDHLLNATALHTVTQNVNRMIMPAAVGFIISGFGAEWAYVGIAAMYVVALLMLFAVPLTMSGASSSRGMAGSVGEGFRYAAGNKTIRGLLIIAFVGSLFGQPLQHLLPLFADVLDITVEKVGLLFTAFGVGSLMGSTTSASLGDFRHKGLLLIGFMMFWGVSIVAFAASGIFLLSLLLMIPLGFGHSGRNTLNIATLQVYTAPEMRGRVMALNAMMSGFIPVAVLFITGAAEIWNAQVAVGGAGAAILVYGFWELLLSRNIRHLE
jgi:MFS family permease